MEIEVFDQMPSEQLPHYLVMPPIQGALLPDKLEHPVFLFKLKNSSNIIK